MLIVLILKLFLNLDNKKSKARGVGGSDYEQTDKYDQTNQVNLLQPG